MSKTRITADRLKAIHGEKQEERLCVDAGFSAIDEVMAILREIRQEGDFTAFAGSFVHSEDPLVARNALWVLTKASDKELAALQVMLHELIDLAMSTDSSSVCRLSLTVVDRLKMEEADLRTDFLDFCMDHMARVDEYPGIQSVCMKLAFKMCRFYPELMDELKRILEAMETDYYKPAVKSVRNRILSGRMK